MGQRIQIFMDQNMEHMASKYDLKNMRDDMIKQIKRFLTQNCSSQEEDKENMVGKPHSQMNEKFKHLEKNIPDQSSIHDPPHHGFNLKPRNYFITKIKMRNFDGNDPITWIFCVKQLFDLHQVPTLQKVTITSFYLELDQYVWYQWICDCKHESIVPWSIFVSFKLV